MPKSITTAIEKIWNDLQGRRGIGNELEAIDPEIQDEIKQVWRDAISEAIIAENTVDDEVGTQVEESIMPLEGILEVVSQLDRGPGLREMITRNLIRDQKGLETAEGWKLLADLTGFKYSGTLDVDDLVTHMWRLFCDPDMWSDDKDCDGYKVVSWMDYFDMTHANSRDGAPEFTVDDKLPGFYAGWCNTEVVNRLGQEHKIETCWLRILNSSKDIQSQRLELRAIITPNQSTVAAWFLFAKEEDP
jgi:hypothetical protein